MHRAKKYVVHLSEDERAALTQFVAKGQKSARQITRARILLLSDQGHTDAHIQAVLGVSRPTISKLRHKYSQGGYGPIVESLQEKPRPGRPIKADSRVQAQITMLACADPPEGAAKWTLRLLADRMVALDYIDSISHETVGQVLKKTN